MVSPLYTYIIVILTNGNDEDPGLTIMVGIFILIFCKKQMILACQQKNRKSSVHTLIPSKTVLHFIHAQNHQYVSRKWKITENNS